MTYTQGVILGVVQGLTEFLPVSSSGHLILASYFFGWPDQGLGFDAALHLGTLAALFAYFRNELRDLVVGGLSRGFGALLLVATIPGGLAGLLFQHTIETHFRTPLLIAVSTAFWALVMWVADRFAAPAPARGGDPIEGVGWGRGMTIGVAQALALIPGTSRSGVTITAGLLGGLDRATAARFAFLLGIPITGLAGALKVLQLARTGLPPGEVGPLTAGVVASFVSGWLAVSFLVAYLKRRSLTPFVVYRLLLAGVILVVALA